MKKRKRKPLGAMELALLQEGYNSLCGKLRKYRIDQELHGARKTVLDFITGLRFSALLIYEMRTILKNTGLDANWGTIIDDSGEKCSPECDIIVHKNGSERAWNGDDDVGGPVMDFHFIHQKNVKLVVSCKGLEATQINTDMKDYIKKLADFVSNVWLFIECCNFNQINKLRKDAKGAGYTMFYYLYSLKKGEVGDGFDETEWNNFAISLRDLAKE